MLQEIQYQEALRRLRKDPTLGHFAEPLNGAQDAPPRGLTDLEGFSDRLKEVSLERSLSGTHVAGIQAHHRRLLTQEGKPRVLIVASRFNPTLTDGLTFGALVGLCEPVELGHEQLICMPRFSPEVVRVPGAFEIPYAISRLVKRAKAQGRPYVAAVALAVVIKGETAHFEYVAEPVSHALCELSVALELPVMNALIPAHTQEQADVRCGGERQHGSHNKGFEAVLALLDLCESLEGAGVHE